MTLYLTESILNESVSSRYVEDALDKRQAIVITYNDDSKNPYTGPRYIEPYVYGLTKRNNKALRAYQYYGSTKRGVPKWKLFRLDRIQSWEPQDAYFNLEPKARGWAAQAFNDNGDGSLIEVLKIVNFDDFDNDNLSDYQRLKARTQALRNSKPININDFNSRYNKPQESQSENTPSSPNPSGPIDATTVQQQTQGVESPVNTNDNLQNTSEPLQQNGVEVSPTYGSEPVKVQDNTSGPITGDTTSPEENKAEDLMNNDDFRAMLQHNLKLTDKEKQKRKLNNKK